MRGVVAATFLQIKNDWQKVQPAVIIFDDSNTGQARIFREVTRLLMPSVSLLMVAAILEASMSTLQEGQLLLERIREMGVHADVQNRHATTAACYGIEHLLELLQDRRRHLEELWLQRRIRLEQCLQLLLLDQEVGKVRRPVSSKTHSSIADVFCFRYTLYKRVPSPNSSHRSYDYLTVSFAQRF